MAQVVSPVQGRTDWIERAAIGGSLLCMAHCLALPLLIATLPALSTALPVPESLHWWIIAFAAPAALVALIGGRARHGRSWPLMAGLVGLALLSAGALLGENSGAETPVTVLGSLTLAAAHIANWRKRHGCAA